MSRTTLNQILDLLDELTPENLIELKEEIELILESLNADIDEDDNETGD